MVSLGGGALGPGGLSALGGQPGGAASSIGQGVTNLASSATTGLALAAIGSWVSGSATFVLHQTAQVLAQTTAPHLDTTWFSAAYWRMSGISAVLTLPFLFAASVQALVRSDLALLVRAALGYLPLAMLAVAVAARATTLLLSASDQLAAVVSSASGHHGVGFLDGAVGPLAALGTFSGSPFLAFLVGLFTVFGALMLWIELLMREAAVYVIVLMLPLAFAAFVWPARRIWAIRSVELLVALILSKFAIVAVLSLGGAALGHSVNDSLTGMLAGVVLLILAAFTPWALLRLVPLAEIASGAAGALRAHSGGGVRALERADSWATAAQRWADKTTHMRRAADLTHASPRLPEPATAGPVRDEPKTSASTSHLAREEPAVMPPEAPEQEPSSSAAERRESDRSRPHDEQPDPGTSRDSPGR